MLLSNRLVIKDFWGTNTRALSYAVTSPLMLNDAAARGANKNIIGFRRKEKSTYDSKNVSVFPLGLDYTRVYDPVTNVKTAWEDRINGAQYFQEFPNANGAPIGSLGHTAMEAGSYLTTGNFILDTTAFCVRLQLNEYAHSEGEEFLDVCGLTWGSDSARYQLLITNQGSAIMQRSASWAQPAEDTYFALLSITSKTTQDDEDIQTLRKQLYTDYTELSLQGDKEKNGGTLYELTIIPERMGKVSVYNGDEFAGEMNCTRLLRKRKSGSLWPASKLGVYRAGGHFLWQVGWPEFAQFGEMRFPYNPGNKNGAVNWNVNGDEPTGTDIYTTDDADTNTLIIQLTTSDTRQTPFLYAAHAFVDAGARSGTSTVKLDTNNKLDSAGNSPIMNIRPAFEGEFRRAQFDVTMRDPNGSVLAALGYHYDSAENHTCDLYIGGAKVLTNGLVKSATPTMLKATTDNTTRGNIAKNETGVEWTICDQWALLEEYLTYEGEIVGDGLYMGELLRRCLRAVGISYDYMSSTIKTVPGGPLLPSAAFGESWCVVSGSGTMADFITETVEKWGMGKRVWIDGNGVWQFGYRSTSVAIVAGHNAAFSSSDDHTDKTYPGRFVMMNPLDYPRDMADFANSVTVIGADAFGEEPVWANWTDWASVKYSANNVPKNFIGRIKVMQPVTDTNCRTVDKCIEMARSLCLKASKPPQYIGFHTWYHYGLFIGSYITCDGVTCEITRISDADIANDRMYIMARVVG